MGPFRTHCIDCDSAYAIFIEAVKRSGQGPSCQDRSLPYTASMTKEKHASGSSQAIFCRRRHQPRRPPRIIECSTRDVEPRLSQRVQKIKVCAAWIVVPKF